MIYAAIAIILIIILYLLAIRGRVGYKKLSELQDFNYAHRGLHGNGVAENSMTAFKNAKEKGYGIELDIHLLKDGTLAVIHDCALKRTTGEDGNIEDLTADELKNYTLEGTEDTIPTFKEVLDLYDGTAPIIVELKPLKNQAALAKAAAEMLKDYKGAYCIESFDPRCILWLKKNRPEIIRGQLCQNFFKTDDKLNFFIKLLLTNSLLNFLTKPDFVAYNFSHRKNLSTTLCKKLWKMQMVGWTLRTKESQKQAEKEGWLSIFEYYLP